MGGDDNTPNWFERAREGVHNCLDFLKEHGSMLADQAVKVTGVTALASYSGTFLGIEMEDGAGAKIAVAIAVIGYRIYKAIKKEQEKEQKTDPNSIPVNGIGIDDYRALQKNMETLLQSHETVTYALGESEKANRELQIANAKLGTANQELIDANQTLKRTISQIYNSEIESAESQGLIERVPFDPDGDDSVLKVEEDIEDEMVVTGFRQN